MLESPQASPSGGDLLLYLYSNLYALRQTSNNGLPFSMSCKNDSRFHAKFCLNNTAHLSLPGIIN